MSSFGLNPSSGIKDEDVKAAPGCTFMGSSLVVTTHRNTAETVESSEKKPVRTKFDRIEMNGRPGAIEIAQGTEQARACTAMFNSGRGTVDVIVRTKNPNDQGHCDKAQEIANHIEPTMPPKQ